MIWETAARLLLRACVGLPVGTRYFVAHVCACQLGYSRQYEDGVPVSHELLEDLDSNRHRHSSREVWEPAVDAGVLVVSREYERPTDDSNGSSREYQIADENLLDEVADAMPKQVQEADRLGLYSLQKGTTTTKRAKTLLNDRNRNPVGTPMWRKAMRTIKFGYFNEGPLLLHLEGLEAEKDAAKAAWVAAGERKHRDAFANRLAALDRGAAASGKPPLSYADRLAEERRWARERGESPFTPEYAAYRRARGRWRNDRFCHARVLAQRPEPTEYPGVYRYRQAYAHQTSGRAGAIGGMQQNMTREGKAASYCGIPRVRNYDLRASQPNFLVEEFEAANEHLDPPRSPLDTSWLEGYMGDPSSKRRCADKVGVEVDTWKTVLCAVMMAAHLHTNLFRSEGEAAVAIREDPGLQTPDEKRAAWESLREVIRPLYEETGRWRAWLDMVWAKEAPTCPGGRAVRNHAGEVYIWSERTPRHERRAQLAAHMLQGREAAFILHLITLASEYSYEVISHEHDGLVTIGEIPEEAVERARQRAGVRRADLVEKPFV